MQQPAYASRHLSEHYRYKHMSQQSDQWSCLCDCWPRSEHHNLHTVHRRYHCLDGNAKNLGHQHTSVYVIDHPSQVALLTKTSVMFPNRSITSAKGITYRKPHQIAKSLDLLAYPSRIGRSGVDGQATQPQLSQDLPFLSLRLRPRMYFCHVVHHNSEEAGSNA